MTFKQASNYINKEVRLINPRLYIDNTYILTDIIVNRNQKGIVCYSCRLAGNNNSAIVCRLEELYSP